MPGLAVGSGDLPCNEAPLRRWPQRKRVAVRGRLRAYVTLGGGPLLSVARGSQAHAI